MSATSPEEGLGPSGGRRLTVRIERLVAGGHGLARQDGLVVFVPATAPGELVRVEEVRRARDYLVGRVVDVIEPSPERRDPPCPIFPACGGCQWQHLPYERQLRAKEEILSESFRRLGRFPSVPQEPIVPSPSEFHYRHRVQLKVLTSGGRMRWGFYASTSHRLVEVRRCLIVHPAVNAILARLDGLVGELGVNPGHLGCFEINVDGTGLKAECILHPKRRRFPLPVDGRRLSWRTPEGGELELSFVNATMVRRLPVQSRAFTFPSLGCVLSSGAGVFSQNNLSLNPSLVARVVAFADPAPTDRVADIFCGVGNYSLPLAARAGFVEAVENNRRSCLYGEINARDLGLANIRFMPRTAIEALPLLTPGTRTLVINPPRVGAADIMAGLAGLGAERLVYVSCDPSTLARDLGLLAGSGYRLLGLAPFDMFPQTHHLETVALMVGGA